MANTNKWQFKIILSVVWGIPTTISLTIPPAFAETKFSDIQGHWAQSCIEQLASRKIITGRQDGTFAPTEPVSRAEFSVIIRRAFPNITPAREAINFADIPSDYWAAEAIQYSYRTNFLTGYSNRIFNPNRKITRLQALMALASGLKYSPKLPAAETLAGAYEDAADIPEWGRNALAAVTENRIVVNYPNVKRLNPNQIATRADVAAFVCQALFKGQTAVVPAQYIAGITPTSPSRSTTSQPQTSTAQTPSATLPPGVIIKTTAVDYGNVRAELSYQVRESSNIGSNLRLKIIRGGKTVTDEPILIPKRKNSNEEVLAERSSEGQVLNLVVRNLDSEREPEVIVDLLSSAGNGDGFYSYIYRYEPQQNRYIALEQYWANIGYEVRDIEADGIPEFESLDIRFASALDLPSGDTTLPKRIWNYRQGQMLDVTKQYPELVSEHTKQLWQLFQERRRQNQDVKAVLAAYIANKYTLGQEVEGWKKVKDAYKERDREDYFALVRKILTDYGYMVASAPQQENPTATSKNQNDTNQSQRLQLITSFSGVLNPVFSTAISPDGKILAVGSDKQIQLWDVTNGKKLKTLEGHNGNIWSLVFSPNGETLISCSGDATIKLWNVRTGELQRTLSHENWVNFVAISPDGETLVSAYKTVRLWNTNTGELQKMVAGFGPIGFSPDGQILLSSDGKGKIQIRDARTGELRRTIRVSESSDEGLSLMALAPDNKTVASVRVGKGTIEVWELRNGRRMYLLDGEVSEVKAIAISPNSEILASATGEGKIQLWNLRAGELLESFPAYSMAVKGVVFSPDGKQLVSVGSDNEGAISVKIWQLPS